MFCIIYPLIFVRKGGKGNGLPHQRARWFAMTFFGGVWWGIGGGVGHEEKGQPELPLPYSYLVFF